MSTNTDDNAATTTPPPAVTESERAPEASPLVDPAWLDDPANDHILVDARSAARYAEGHLPGAVNIPAESFNNPEATVSYQLGSGEQVASVLGAAGIGPDDTVVLYDADASLYATRAYFAMTYYGRGDLRILDGGTAVWEAEGRELTTQRFVQRWPRAPIPMQIYPESR